MKNKRFFILTAAFILIMAAAFFAYSELSKSYSPDKLNSATQNNDKYGESDKNSQSGSNTDKAADFTVLNSDGEEVSLSDYFGKPIVLNFWATWCGPCKSELPAFNKLYSEYGENIEFMMVNLTDGFREKVDKVKEFAENEGYDFPIYFDTEQNAFQAYKAFSIPMTYFIDENGAFKDSHLGSMSEEILRAYLDGLIE